MKKFTLIATVGLILILTTIRTYADTTFVVSPIVNETWTIDGSPYCATSDVFVSGLTIEPGVDIIFLGNYVLEIGGVLTAIGTEQDTIEFNKVATIDGWQGIYFNYSFPGSEIAFCRIEGSQNSGIRILNSEPIIRNSMITNNSSSSARGGGINTNSSTYLESCIISNNSINIWDYEHFGGGIFSSAELILINCEISANSIYVLGSNVIARGGGIYADGVLSIENCTISDNSLFAQGSNVSNQSKGGGVWLESGALSLKNSTIANNSVSASSLAGGTSTIASGGGLFLNSGSHIISNSIIAYNILENAYSRFGGGVNGHFTDAIDLMNCTIAYNSHEGLYCEDGANSVINSIVWGNSLAQVSGTVSVTYSDIQNGFSGEGNINFNPIFLSDTYLHIVPGSPCIDAGNPDPAYNDECFPPSLGTELNDMGVDGGPLGCNWYIPSDSTNIQTYSLPEETSVAVINPETHSVNIEVEYGTNLTNLVATFSLSDGANATVGGILQVSGTTANDFTNPVTYTILAEDGTTEQDWIVTVSIASSTETDILTYSFTEQTGSATIDTFANTVSIEVEYGTDLTNLIASFTISDGANATVGGIPQVSGVTENDFTNPATYTILAEDGTTEQDWIVTVSIASSTETDILTYSFTEQTGSATIDTVAITVSIEVEYGTDLTNLIASFTISDGANTTVGGIPQVSGVTANDFTNPVTYTILAEDGTTVQDWIVTVSLVSSTETDFLTFSFPEQTSTAIIDTIANTINIEVGYGTDLTNLIATFTLSDGANTTVGGINQVSGTTENDFTNPVTYEITAQDGITVQDWIVAVDSTTGINEHSIENLKIYPNPFSTRTIIEFDNPNHIIYSLIIRDISGTKIFELDNINSNKAIIEGNKFSKGMYLLELISDNNIICKKLIVR